jgi:hypothetical protein
MQTDMKWVHQCNVKILTICWHLLPLRASVASRAPPVGWAYLNLH